MKYFFLLLSFLLTTPCLLAQPLAGSSNDEQLRIAADSARANQNWFVALENYDKLYESTEDEALLPIMALMNLRLRDVASAVRGYTRVFRRAEPSDPTNNEHRFYYGQALKMDGQYDEARTYFENFLQHAEDERMITFARLELEGIKLYRDVPQETSEVELENLGRKVNGLFSEYSPIQSADGTLYFSTWKASKPIPQGDEDGYSQIFLATADEEGEYGKPEALGKEVNRPGVHSANPALSADGRVLFYNRMALQANKILESKLYFSEVEDDGWKSGNPVSGLNSDNHLILQPAMGELFGREVLFFVSDMDGGEGGLDIYYADYEGDGRFGAPVNLGPRINTIGDDATPFYFDGTLYFSSNGYPTMGGDDLFYSAWNGSEWGEVTNMGPGFNSTVDDKSLSIYGDGLIGFMTSNREGGRSVKSKTCCDDIYGFEIASLYANLVVGLFNEGKEALTNGTIVLQPIQNGNRVGVPNSKTRNDGNRFDFGLDLETEYLVVASHPGYLPDSVEINTLGLTESKDIQQIFFLKAAPTPPEPTGPIYDTIEVEEAVVLENILFDFDDSKILTDAEGDLRQLQEIMESNPEMVIELSAHTDARGNDSYNQALSKRRAASARKWLIVQGGISGPRIKTAGYGETQPQTVSARLASRVGFLNEGDVLTESFINALPTEEQQELAHRLNRRVEFKVLEGPEQFIIRRDVIERKLEGADRGSDVPAATRREDDRPLRVTPQGGRSSTTPAPVSIPPAPASAPPIQTLPKDSITRFSSLFGQTDIEGKPILVFDRREVALGDVPHGESRTFEVSFVNRGTAPAKISLVQACDCTTVDYKSYKTYAPGEGDTLTVTFDSTEKEEDETVTIDIFLEQEDSRGMPILEMIEYSYHLLR